MPEQFFSHFPETNLIKNPPKYPFWTIDLDLAGLYTPQVEDHAIIKYFKSPDVKVGVWFLKRNVDLLAFIMNNPDISRGYSDVQISEITNLDIRRLNQLRKECSS